MACIVRGYIAFTIWVHKGFVLSRYWRSKIQNALQAGAQSLIKVFVMHRERDAFERHWLSLCVFVLLSVIRSKSTKLSSKLQHDSQCKMCSHRQGLQTQCFHLIKFLCNTLNTLQFNSSKAKIHHNTRSAQSSCQMNSWRALTRKEVLLATVNISNIAWIKKMNVLNRCIELL